MTQSLKIFQKSETSSFSNYKQKIDFVQKQKNTQEISKIKTFTVYIAQTFKKCDPNYYYDPGNNYRRILTDPSDGVLNDGFDNINNDYILRVHDVIIHYNKDKSIKTEYQILDLLGQGTFGQVVKCINVATNQLVAIKCIKNKPAYFHQAKIEIQVLKILNEKQKNSKTKKIVQMLDFFLYYKHLFIVFEILEISLYNLLQSSNYDGFSLGDISSFAKQIIEGLILSEEQNIIHCDLKPENILFINKHSKELKVIDFGSACQAQNTIYTYIQSRFYRAPEIILGLEYSLQIDIWSLGCICAELYLGLPIFPGNSQYDQLRRIINILGKPKDSLIDSGRFKNKFFKQEKSENIFKTEEEFEESEDFKLQPSKQYFKLTSLEDLRMYYDQSKYRIQEEYQNFDIFLDFLKGLLQIDPIDRWKCSKAIMHPFIQNQYLMNQKIQVQLPYDFSSFSQNLENDSRNSDLDYQDRIQGYLQKSYNVRIDKFSRQKQKKNTWSHYNNNQNNNQNNNDNYHYQNINMQQQNSDDYIQINKQDSQQNNQTQQNFQYNYQNQQQFQQNQQTQQQFQYQQQNQQQYQQQNQQNWQGFQNKQQNWKSQQQYPQNQQNQQQFQQNQQQYQQNQQSLFSQYSQYNSQSQYNQTQQKFQNNQNKNQNNQQMSSQYQSTYQNEQQYQQNKQNQKNQEQKPPGIIRQPNKHKSLKMNLNTQFFIPGNMNIIDNQEKNQDNKNRRNSDYLQNESPQINIDQSNEQNQQQNQKEYT